VTFTGACQKIFSSNPRIGFLAQARQLEAAVVAGTAVSARLAEIRALILNARLDAIVCGVFIVLVATVLIDSLWTWYGILRGTRDAKTQEAPFVLSQLSSEET
jgi:carbon starvation protein